MADSPITVEEQAQPLPTDAVVFARIALAHRFYSIVLSCFARRSATTGLTVEDIANRLGIKPLTVRKRLSSPDGWTLETVSDLLLAMGYEVDSLPLRSL